MPPAPHLATDLRTVVTRLVKKLRTHSPSREQLSLTERSVVRLLDQHPHLLPSELAAREKVTTQAMSQILRHLAARGYLTRQPSPTDRRKVLVALAPAGRALLRAARQERDEWLHQTLQQTCSAAELACLQQALPILSKLVDAD
ncbi:MarR family transcriptional regulator [Hymenobacter sp. RP-2-7]|uniref:MarR family transcriptional regulator n=1 Tax=Hymenobacter polaris TaxID=2682546 RepID=A0A7Y0AAL2_9BACT|nr:MarR family transcriptional regulator [Hymenobacter polaris]NML63835.1 MarR family transcriptional regulator [Hymenobacter polaris]